MSKFFSVAGYLAAAVLIVLGVAVTVVGLVGRGYVQDQLAREAIVGSADMTPAKIEPAIKAAGLEGVSAPSRSGLSDEVCVVVVTDSALVAGKDTDDHQDHL